MIPAPNPCTKRPTTSTGIDGASPPTSSPTVNVEMPHASAGANPRRSASSPPSMMPIIEPRKKAVTTHPYHTIPWRSASMSGRMLTTDSVSDAVITVPATRPNFTARREKRGSPSSPVGPAGSGCPLARSCVPEERIAPCVSGPDVFQALDRRAQRLELRHHLRREQAHAALGDVGWHAAEAEHADVAVGAHEVAERRHLLVHLLRRAERLQADVELGHLLEPARLVQAVVHLAVELVAGRRLEVRLVELVVRDHRVPVATEPRARLLLGAVGVVVDERPA